jgi:3-hydroxy-9,10-secoandrosta-1,3,5(10)-triene-9,17-dione monooxygenase reductase component
MTDSQIDPRHYRDVLGHFPTGVTVVTGLDSSGAPHGMTIGSFSSVSLDPPLVGFLPGMQSRSWPAISESGKFCVNILTDGQDELCWKFAKEPTDGETSKFSGVEWKPSVNGSPILAGVIGWIDCTIEVVYEVGDHFFVVGRVQDLAQNDDVATAMVFFRGKVASVTMPTDE